MTSSQPSVFRSVFVCVAVLLLLYEAWTLTHILWYRSHPPLRTAFMETQLARQPRPAPIDYRWIAYDKIPASIKRAVIAAEDSRFTQHDGFDWQGMRHAFDRNLRRGKIVAGGSTITQQLAKNLFLSASRNPLRKVQEAVITVMLEACLGKRRILELYLNVIEWGNNIYGVEAAAQHYFGTSARRLAPAQAARLAAMIPNPVFFERHPQSRAIALRSSIYLRRMSQVDIPR